MKGLIYTLIKIDKTLISMIDLEYYFSNNIQLLNKLKSAIAFLNYTNKHFGLIALTIDELLILNSIRYKIYDDLRLNPFDCYSVLNHKKHPVTQEIISYYAELAKRFDVKWKGHFYIDKYLLMSLKIMSQSKLKPQLIIVEGPDNVGKSTLIEYIRDKFNHDMIAIYHSSKPDLPNDILPEEIKNIQMSYYKDKLERLVEAINDYEIPVILDRSYIGEFVYGTLYRNVDYKPEDFIELDIITADIENVSLIYLKDTIENRLARDDGNSLSIDKLLMQSEQDKFDYYTMLSCIKNKVVIDWSNKEFNQKTFDEIINKALIIAG